MSPRRKPPKPSRLATQYAKPTRTTRATARAESASSSVTQRIATNTKGKSAMKVYDEMLAEAGADEEDALDEEFGGDRKRRRVGERAVHDDYEFGDNFDESADDFGVGLEENVSDFEIADVEDLPETKKQQTAYDIDASDDEFAEEDDDEEGDSEMEFEDVELSATTSTSAAPMASASKDGDQVMQFTLDKPDESISRKPQKKRRKPASPQERKARLDVHKMHILCLLSHLESRNKWCNDDEVQSTLRKLLTRRIVDLLNPDESKTQFERAHAFNDGLKMIAEIWRRAFVVVGKGMRRPYWAEEVGVASERLLDDLEIIENKEVFRNHAKSRTGSRDLGAQLFCALLRSAGVDVRLVCSLQVLPFSGVAAEQATPTTTPQKTIQAESLGFNAAPRTSAPSSPASAPSPAPTTTPAPRRRIGQPSFGNRGLTQKARPAPPPAQAPPLPKPTPESPYPVFWVEAFNEAIQKWIPADPIVTNTINLANKFEPSAADLQNNLSYIIAFEDDNSARDVTRRYAKGFNSKTRKTRVESTKGGEAWLKAALRRYEKPFLEDRDQVEMGEFTAKIAREPMPRSVADYKDHPIYALERHLRRNEVIYPKREVGKVATVRSAVSMRKGKGEKVEAVYRRRDVHIVKSANGWYRLGRDVKVGEQPLKRVTMKKRGKDDGDDAFAGEIPDDEEDEDTALYAFFQTELYLPPPVVKGRIPKNVYGNLDVYVPSMVPPGGVHIKHADAKRAARTLGIDYADAVTGFDFKGRHGTARIQGVVIAQEFQESIIAVLKGFVDQAVRDEERRRERAVLRMWKKMLVGLRVRRRIERLYGEVGDGPVEEEMEEEYQDEDDEDDNYVARRNAHEDGGFFPDQDEPEAVPTGRMLRDRDPEPEAYVPPSMDTESGFEGGGFIPDEAENEALVQEHAHTESEDGFEGGGFMLEEEAGEGLVGPQPASQGEDSFDGGGGFFGEDEEEDGKEVPALNLPMATSEEDSHTFVTEHPSSAIAAIEEQSIPTPPQDLQTNAVSTKDVQTAHKEVLPARIAKAESPPLQSEGQPGEQQESSIKSPEADADAAPQSSSSSEIENDNESLMSHDPDDDDAEPEWIANL